MPERPAAYHLAQFNVGRLLAPLDSPQIADFVAALEPVNALADTSPGFVWRLQTAEGDATALRPFEDDRIIVNFSVWTSVETLRDYVYYSAHLDVLRRRREWFEKMSQEHLVLWWHPANGQPPTVEEAKRRLDLLRVQGPTPDAFTFRQTFPPPDGVRAAAAGASGGGGAVVSAAAEP